MADGRHLLDHLRGRVGGVEARGSVGCRKWMARTEWCPERLRPGEPEAESAPFSRVGSGGITVTDQSFDLESLLRYSWDYFRVHGCCWGPWQT